MKKCIFFLITAILFTSSFSASAMPFFDAKEQVLILTYHRLSTDSSMANDYTITPDTFEGDIKLLKEKGYEFLKASELEKSVLKGRKIAVITFDDGYLSDIEYAAPILEKYSACATFFIIGEMVGKDGYMSSEQVKVLSQKACCEIGNHSYSLHSNPASTLSVMYREGKCNDKIVSDFAKNNEFLQELTGISPVAVSYPNGIYNIAVDRALRKSGITVTFSTVETSYKSSLVTVGRKNRGQNRDVNSLLK